MKLRLFAASLVAAALSATSAHAIPVTWTVDFDNSNLNFAVDGTFVYDADTNMFSNINVTATDDSGVSNTTYTMLASHPFAVAPSASDWQFSNSAGPDFTGSKTISFGLQNPASLTNAGGLLSNNFLVQSQLCLNSMCSGVQAVALVDPITGTLTGVAAPAEIPLPAALPLFLAGLAGLGFVKRKRKTAKS